MVERGICCGSPPTANQGLSTGKWKKRIRSDADAAADADADTNQNSFFSPLQCRTEAKHGYSFACLAY